MGFLVRTVVRIQQLKQNNHHDEHIIRKRYSLPITNSNDDQPQDRTFELEMITSLQQQQQHQQHQQQQHCLIEHFDHCPLYDRQLQTIIQSRNNSQHVHFTSNDNDDDDGNDGEQFFNYMDDDDNRCLELLQYRNGNFIKSKQTNPTTDDCSSSLVITLV